MICWLCEPMKYYTLPDPHNAPASSILTPWLPAMLLLFIIICPCFLCLLKIFTHQDGYPAALCMRVPCRCLNLAFSIWCSGFPPLIWLPFSFSDMQKIWLLLHLHRFSLVFAASEITTLHSPMYPPTSEYTHVCTCSQFPAFRQTTTGHGTTSKGAN